LSDRLVLIGNLDSLRTRHFVEAVRRTDYKWRIVGWNRVLSGSDEWAEGIEPGTCIRIDSPGQNFEVEKAILRLGVDERDQSFATISARQLDDLKFEKGRILALRQWYGGWRKTLERVEEKLRDRQVRYFNPPADITAMFDKPRCNYRLSASGVSTPPILGFPRGFDALVALMRKTNCTRVFLKPYYSSSASGIVAFESQGGRQQAFSSLELVREGGEIKLYNSRRVRRYESLTEIRNLIDAISRESVYAERWLPKAGLDGKRLDLRIVVIAGRARHAVVRLSDHPMTNLQLGARRGDLGLLKRTMGEEAWQRALALAEAGMKAFPQSHYGGLDVLISPGWKKACVLEVNAFGDFLPQLRWKGQDTYSCELAAFQVSTMGR